WPLAHHCTLVDADGAGIVPVSDWPVDHSARRWAEGHDQSARWQVRRGEANLRGDDSDRDWCRVRGYRRGDWSAAKASRDLTLQVLYYLATRIQSRRAGHAATGMSSGSAQVQTFHRRSILRRADEWSEREELVQRHLAVMNVPAG